MSSEVLTQAVGPAPANPATFGAGRIFNVLSAPGGPISVVAERRSPTGGQSLQRVFTNIPAGSKFVAEKGHEWTYLRVSSASAQTIVLFVGDEDLAFNNAVTVTGTAVVSVSGTANVASTSATVNDTADTVQAFGTQTVIGANLNRRRITIGVRASSADSVRVSGAGGAGHGVELAPGTFAEFDTTASLTVRNDNAAGNATWYAIEEV